MNLQPQVPCNHCGELTPHVQSRECVLCVRDRFMPAVGGVLSQAALHSGPRSGVNILSAPGDHDRAYHGRRRDDT